MLPFCGLRGDHVTSLQKEYNSVCLKEWTQILNTVSCFTNSLCCISRFQCSALRALSCFQNRKYLINFTRENIQSMKTRKVSSREKWYSTLWLEAKSFVKIILVWKTRSVFVWEKGLVCLIWKASGLRWAWLSLEPFCWQQEALSSLVLVRYEQWSHNEAEPLLERRILVYFHLLSEVQDVSLVTNIWCSQWVQQSLPQVKEILGSWYASPITSIYSWIGTPGIPARGGGRWKAHWPCTPSALHVKAMVVFCKSDIVIQHTCHELGNVTKEAAHNSNRSLL